MESENPPLEVLAEAVLQGQAVDWATAESSAKTPPQREAVRQLRVLFAIVELHRSFAEEIPGTVRTRVLEAKLARWGRLEIREGIGGGSFGDVYRAWDTKLDREVALKLLKPGGEGQGAEVLREARLLARVRHPNVVTVYDADEIEGRVGLWMEFIHGQNLEQILSERKKFDDREVTRIGIELCRALSAVHEAGLLHRDIKTQNLMQSSDGRLVLMDFGTGWDLDKATSSDVEAAGTPLYLAPEIFRGALATVRTDIYSVGVLLFHLLTGAYPVVGSTVQGVQEAHARGQRLELFTGAFRRNKPLVVAVGRAIDPDPLKRFESMRDMLVALEDARRRKDVPHRVSLIGAGFAVVTLAVGGAAWLSRNGSRSATEGTVRAVPIRGRDWVLVTNLENRTGEKLLDGTLDYALRSELSTSHQVSIVSRDRVNDALRLMRKPPDMPIDLNLAREICLRDGGIRALVTGRVERLGSRYVTSVEIIEPKEGTPRAGFSEESENADGSLRALRRISDRIRSALGETLIPDRQRDSLAKVTTANLKALQLYSRGDLMMREVLEAGHEGYEAAAEELLRQAVAEDPTFASAWILLAWTLFGQNRPLAEVRPYLDTAMRLADTTTERERYFIRGSYYQMLGQREKAIAAYEALLDLYPDHFWAPLNLGVLYDYPSNPKFLDKGLRVVARYADSRPNDFKANWVVAYDYTCFKHDSDRAAPYLRRAAALITPEVRGQFPMIVDWIDLLPFAEDWVKGDLTAAAGEIDQVAAKIDSLEGVPRDYLTAQIALADLTLGRVASASQTAEKIVDPMVRNDMLAEIDFVKGDRLALLRHLKSPGDRLSHQFSRHSWDTRLSLEIRAGLLSEPEHLQNSEVWRPEESCWLRAAMALAHSHVAVALTEFEKGSRRSVHLLHCPSEYLVRDSLAEALAKRGDLRRAIQILEQDPERFYAAVGGESAAYWLADRLELDKLYRAVGRLEDAQAIEEELWKLLALADSDHPILVELQQLRGHGREGSRATVSGRTGKS